MKNRNIILAYILDSLGDKYPIKYAELLEIVGKDKKALAEVLPAVKESLENVYGILWKDLPDDKSGKKFICIAEKCHISKNELNEDQQRKTTLLIIILSYIYVRGGHLDENELENFLKKCEIYYEQEHRYFGNNIKKLVTETFVRQLYIKKTKYEGFDMGFKNASCSYSWGFRAEVEVDKKVLLESLARLCKKPQNHFLNLYGENQDETMEVN